MHFRVQVALLASILATLSVTPNGVQAFPAKRSGEIITLPLAKRSAPNGQNTRPKMHWTERGRKRIAYMRGLHGVNSAVKRGDTGADFKASDNSINTNPDSVAASQSTGLGIQFDDTGYFATIEIGTPPRNFSLLMDSGSSDFWVTGENCQSDAGGGCNHTPLGPQTSSTLAQTGKRFLIQYGTGNAAGDVVTDKVSMAGLELGNIPFGAARSISSDESDPNNPTDGIMGLARSSLNTAGVLTPVDFLAQQQPQFLPIVSFRLGRVADGTNEGQVSFGGADSSQFVANTLVKMQNINPDGLWEANLDDASVNGQPLGLKAKTAILDTGTNVVVAPASDAAAVHAAIPGARDLGQGTFSVPCSNSAQVALSFAGRSFVMDPRDLVLPAELTPGNCQSAIVGDDPNSPTPNQWLVGAAFLKNTYFMVDSGSNSIALATPQ